MELKLTNGLCESLLGLNDHLTTTVSNLSQLSRSNLIEVKKNRTIQWLNRLPFQEQEQSGESVCLKESTSQERPSRRTGND